MTTTTMGSGRARPFSLRLPLRRLSYASIASALLVVLLLFNVYVDRSAFELSGITYTIGLASPLVLAAIAITPAILVGGGGIDLSVGPLMSLTGAIVVVGVIGNAGLSAPYVVIPVALLCGVASGALNGFLVAIVRLQPIVATLGTYLAYVGLSLTIAPQPTGTVPTWLSELSAQWSFVLVVGVLVFWAALTRTPLYGKIMATGGDDRAAYAAGINVTAVRMSAYVVTGLLASVAGLSLTALLGSVDPNAGTQFTLLAVASVALGGVSLAGGRGGMLGSVVGGINIFLIQNILTYYNKSAFTEQLVYGAVLVVAVVGNSLTTRWSGKPA